MNASSEHGRSFIAEVLDIHKAIQSTRLVMVIPEEGTPTTSFTHFLAPSMIETLELFKIKGSNGPFLTIFIVDFQMMEVNSHRQLVALRCWIENTVVNGCRRHLSNGHKAIIRTKGRFIHHTKIVMHNGFIRISWLPFIFSAIHQDLIFPNQIDYIETKAFDALVPPEVDHLEQLLADIGIAPIEVCLRHVKEVKVIFPRISNRRRLEIADWLC